MSETMDEQVEDKFGTDADPVEEQDAEQSDLAKEALDEVSETPAEKPAEETEDRPSVETVAKLREQRREERDGRHKAEIEAAELRGKMAGIQERQTVEAELSPVQVAMKEQGVATEAELDLTTGETMALMRQEHKWEAAQTVKKTAAATETTRQGEVATMQQAAETVDRGEGLDYRTIETLGVDLLTEGEKLDISKSTTPFEDAYKLMVRAIQERGNESTKKTLQERLARKNKESDQKETSEKESKVEDETDDEEVVDEPIANPRLAALAGAAVKGESIT